MFDDSNDDDTQDAISSLVWGLMQMGVDEPSATSAARAARGDAEAAIEHHYGSGGALGGAAPPPLAQPPCRAGPQRGSLTPRHPHLRRPRAHPHIHGIWQHPGHL